MAITTTMLEQHFLGLQEEVIVLRRLFEKFRGYVNREFVTIHEQLDSLQDSVGKIEDAMATTMATKDDLVALEDRLLVRIEEVVNRALLSKS